MAYTLSLVHASTTNHEEAGYKAMRLAKIAQARYPVPLTLLIPCSLFNEFLAASGIGARIPTIYQKYPQTLDGYTQAFKEIKDLFTQIRFSQALKEELLEAYESLAITTASASTLVSNDEAPAVILIPSQNYKTEKEDLTGTQVNINGNEAFLKAIKNVWLSLYLPEKVQERQEKGIHQYSIGIIVEQQQKLQASAIGNYHQLAENELLIKTYAGYLDLEGDIAKDEYELKAEHLQIYKRIIRDQQYKLIPEHTGKLRPYALGEQGTKQLLNDRQILEIARLTKRAHVLLQKNVTVYTTIQEEDVHIQLVLEETNKGLTKILKETPIQEPEQKDYVPVETMLAEEEKIVPVTIVQEEDQFDFGDTKEEQPQEVPITPQELPKIEFYNDEEPQQPLQEQPTNSSEQNKVIPEPIVEEIQETIIAVTPLPQEPAQEETLFDMIQQEQPNNTSEQNAESQETAVIPEQEVASQQQTVTPEQELLQEVISLLEQELSTRYQEHISQEPTDYHTIRTALQQRQQLPIPEEELAIIESWSERIQQEQPTNEIIGLAWKIRQQLR